MAALIQGIAMLPLYDITLISWKLRHYLDRSLPRAIGTTVVWLVPWCRVAILPYIMAVLIIRLDN